MKIKPLHNHVVIKQQDETETMYGNIVVPDLGKEKAKLYEVIGTSVTYNYHTDKPIFSELIIG